MKDKNVKIQCRECKAICQFGLLSGINLTMKHNRHCEWCGSQFSMKVVEI